MGLKCELFDNVVFQNIIGKMGKHKSDPKYRIGIARFVHKLREEAELYYEQKNPIIKKYFVLDDKGQVKVENEQQVVKGETDEEKAENLEKFSNEFKALGQADIEVSEIPAEWLVESPLTDGELAVLSPIIKDEQEGD